MRRLISLSLFGAILLTHPFAARAIADDQAGAAAFARGDFTRAASEWTPAAAKGDPRAEFGLGEVYEQGKGDYHTADHWYSMAAEHGDAEAKYRLMLIWMAGDKDFAPNLTKAYGWMLIASKGGAASDRLAQLRRQLDAHLDEATRSAGQKFAAAWDAAHPAGSPPQQEAAAKPLPPVAPAAPANPAQPAEPPQQVAVLPVPTPVPDARAKLDAALKALDCASIHTGAVNGITKITGSVANAQDRIKIAVLADNVPASDRPQIDLDVVPPPLCRSLVAADDFSRDHIASAGMIELSMEGNPVLHPGDPIQVDVKSQVNVPVFVRIDYFTLDDQVLHMWPTQYVPNTQVNPGETRRFLYRRPGGPDPAWTVGSPPYGTELILATATQQPLNLDNGLTGMAPDYLRQLTAAFDRERTDGRQSFVAATFIRTAAK
ncbi:MAG TPA: DUF4384 domain-containing protein [Stellaceae bacterium]|nr:DUF4384 domain-containing protein [Stellaceae bacterium]